MKAAIERVETAAPPKQVTMQKGMTFKDVSEDFVLFSHMAVVLYGGLPFDPLLQFYAERNLTDPPLVFVSDDPIFAGLESPAGPWGNHILFGVPKTLWNDLCLHLGTIGIKNSQTNTYINTVIQEVPMVDFPALKSKTWYVLEPIPMVSVFLVALDGNKACLHFKPAERPGDPIRLVRSTPRQIVTKFADSLFNDKPQLERDRDGSPNT